MEETVIFLLSSDTVHWDEPDLASKEPDNIKRETCFRVTLNNYALTPCFAFPES